MKAISKYLFYHFVFYYALIVSGRILFILSTFSQANDISILSIISTFYHGFSLDVSTCCYLMILPLWFVLFNPNKVFTVMHQIIIMLLVSVVILVQSADAFLYNYWQQKFNLYALSFARFPKQAGASLTLSVVVSMVLVLGVQWILSFVFVKKLNHVYASLNTQIHKGYRLLMVIILNVLMFIGIRGGTSLTPINQSAAFFSSNMYLNHTALNAFWNFFSALFEADADQTNTYAEMDAKHAEDIVDSLLATSSHIHRFTNTDNPNVLLILLEGWGADVVGVLGGDSGVTPLFDKAASEGLLFNHAYASGNRTDKGLAAIISAQPSLAGSSIINKIEKFNKLPSLANELKKKGYFTQFRYGGESDFANMKGYWLSAGYSNIKDVNDFRSSKSLQGKWGYHDEQLYKELLDDIETAPAPFFISTLTLSSHEPFEVPWKSSFINSDDAGLYRNAVNYADACLGAFLEQAKSKTWYRNTLIVVVADHGHQWPYNRSAYDPKRFHIPLLITGGALNKAYRGRINQSYTCQTDIPATLLHQMNVNTNSFRWSLDKSDTADYGFIVYTYNNGVGWVDKNLQLVYDYDAEKVIVENNTNQNLLNNKLPLLKAYKQASYEEYILR